MEFELISSSEYHLGKSRIKEIRKYGFEINENETQPVIKINSLEELIKLIKLLDQELIINEERIEIYDDYRE